MEEKEIFKNYLREFVSNLKGHVSTEDGQWTIKGFIDVLQNVYTISSDTKIISKILEIHLFPEILSFAKEIGYKIILAKHQNYYPDISFVKSNNENIKFAVDFKTTYRKPNNPLLCNGFTLGSHGEYFVERSSTKNIQFPYSAYHAHFCLGIIYDRVNNSNVLETGRYGINELHSIASVVKNFRFFVAEKWKIASDVSGSGNTANIGSINNIDDIINERGMFSKLGEKWFDDYWMNYRKIATTDKNRKKTVIKTLKEFVKYRKGDVNLIIPKRRAKPKKNDNKDKN